MMDSEEKIKRAIDILDPHTTPYECTTNSIQEAVNSAFNVLEWGDESIGVRITHSKDK
jgi:hypothetical protein